MISLVCATPTKQTKNSLKKRSDLWLPEAGVEGGEGIREKWSKGTKIQLQINSRDIA